MLLGEAIVTAEMFAPVITQLTSALTIAVPAGLGVMALYMGVRFAIKTFKSVAR